MAQLERPAAAEEVRRRPVVTTISEVRPQDLVRITGVIRSKAALSLSGCPACRYTVTDGTGEVDLLFLGRVLIAGLDTGLHCVAEGRTAVRDGRIVIWNPRYQVLAS